MRSSLSLVFVPLVLLVIGCGEEVEEPAPAEPEAPAPVDTEEEREPAEPEPEPTAMEAMPEVSDVASVALGRLYVCVLDTAGTVRCWGRNDDGQLGDGSIVGRPTPERVSELDGATQLAAGVAHSCVVRREGDVRCWGRNEEGQLGDGTTERRVTPVAVRGIDDAVQVGAGRYSSCALHRGGRVSCWGSGRSGRLGTGAFEDSPVPVEVPGLHDVVEIAVGNHHACARTSAGALWCWGSDERGQTGVDGDLRDRVRSPLRVALSDVRRVAAGTQSTCVVHEHGGVSCWGYWATCGHDVGNPSNGPDDIQVPAVVEGLSNVVALGVGDTYACAFSEEGGLSCWGNPTFWDHPSPVEIGSIPSVRVLAAGDERACAVGDGRLYCWLAGGGTPRWSGRRTARE